MIYFIDKNNFSNLLQSIHVKSLQYKNNHFLI